ncbi:hypothetical protein GCM10022228_07580 [Halomonas cibimaris]|uniref:UDP-glucose 4-epimerase n=1 Tax=Halomonas cibimaris TaxID=657012 RepID=A0ABP7LH78_9GAMM
MASLIRRHLNSYVPFIAQVAVGRREALSVFGNDYPTPDGTGVRDYIHVMDLVEGHLAAMQVLASRRGVGIWNLGTGRGYSVLEMIKAFEKASGRPVPYRIEPRREGDIAECWADPTLAREAFDWQAQPRAGRHAHRYLALAAAESQRVPGYLTLRQPCGGFNDSAKRWQALR